MKARRLLASGPDGKPLWVRLHLPRLGDRWATMILTDDSAPPAPGAVQGVAYFGATPGEAEHGAKVYLGCSEPVN